MAENETSGDHETEQTTLKEFDPFTQHFESLISDDVAGKLLSERGVDWTRDAVIVTGVGTAVMNLVPDDSGMDLVQDTLATQSAAQPAALATQQATTATQPATLGEETNLRRMCIKQSVCNQLAAVNSKHAAVDITKQQLTGLQLGVLDCLNSYRDLYFPARSYAHAEQLRIVYCVHAVNHVLKTRSRVLAHNAKIKSRRDEVPDEYRDQGLTRPKVLILVPFRESALRVVNIMAELLATDRKSVTMKTRFDSEFQKIDDPTLLGKKPADYEATFAGNIDDHFRVGLAVAKKSLKLYTNFLKSDVILASPVGLRALMEQGSDASNCDFLSSIEMLIIDQADVLLMQNWTHVLDILDKLNCTPTESHGVDFSRVRMWSVNGWSRIYRQTVVLSEFDLQLVRSTFLRHSNNYAGRVLTASLPSSSVWVRVIVRMQHEFWRFMVDSPRTVDDQRFTYFTSRILPLITDRSMAQTLIFMSSSLDYIRLRNHLMRNDISFVSLYEHDSPKDVQKARGAFVHGLRTLIILTERFHFFRRYSHIRGIRHIVFYDLPTRPNFYAEVCNWVRDARQPHNEDNATCRVVYCKYDVLRLRAVLGNQRMQEVLAADKERVTLNPPALELRRK